MFPTFFSFLLGISMLFHSGSTAHAAGSSQPVVSYTVVSEKTYSLSDRYSNTYVNNVFADNILLTLAYMNGTAKNGQPVDWSKVRGDFTYTFTLKPGQTFAFHDLVLPQYQGKVAITTNAHFDSTQGFESDGYLVGDGVCHLASFITAVSRLAGLGVVAPTRHDFAVIPDVSEADGTAIYYDPNSPGSSALQNLYVTNTFNVPVTFTFTHKGTNLTIDVTKQG